MKMNIFRSFVTKNKVDAYFNLTSTLLIKILSVIAYLLTVLFVYTFQAIL